MPPYSNNNTNTIKRRRLIAISAVLIVVGIAVNIFFSGPSVSVPKGWVRPAPRVDGTRVIVAFGDSLTAGYGVPLEDSYPAQLQRLIAENGYSYVVVNKGVSGDTTADGMQRLPEVLAERPEIVILALGANDGLQSLSPTDARKRLALMIEAIQQSGSLVLLAGMRAPLGRSADYVKAFDGMYPELAETYRVPLIPFFLKGVVLRPSLTIQDRLHPNKEGYTYIVNETLWPYLKPLLTKSR